ncbi:MAG TPA: rod shape-determining protein MreD [Pyrinomonadaceae bacterium]|nr:rod shape-determining protein MreD [Pyrinomonadaceae bacterium]
MNQLKIATAIAAAAVLQTYLRMLWPPLGYIDFALIIVVYFALQRDAVRAVIIGCLAGLATDALSVGLLGANGFAKTLTAFTIASLSTQVMLDNPLARIPVLAGAALLDTAVYYLMHNLLGQRLFGPFAETAAYKLIWTTVVGTIVLYGLGELFSERARQRRQLAFRRRIARRTSGGRRR